MKKGYKIFIGVNILNIFMDVLSIKVPGSINDIIGVIGVIALVHALFSSSPRKGINLPIGAPTESYIKRTEPPIIHNKQTDAEYLDEYYWKKSKGWIK